MVPGHPDGKGYKAQNNTPTVCTDPDSVNRCQTELIAGHMTPQNQKQQMTRPARRQQKLTAAKER
ncbi:MAG TPA: hypothetical protein VMB73_25600 [Acetobacteraceae bacterium]|nr:hypothetical protein [Acetobacteraceae bacterium]